MEYYVRQIRPYTILKGYDCIPHPIYGYWWVSEDIEEELKEEIEVRESWSELIFLDRFVKVKDVKEIVHGKWLINCDGYYPYCSECKEEPKGGNMTKYCPHCGAKMDKE